MEVTTTTHRVYKIKSFVRSVSGFWIEFNHMRINIKATGFELTAALRQITEEKLGSLSRFLKRWEKAGEVLLRVELAKNTKHHNKGQIFYAEANLDLPQQVLRVEETDADMNTAINNLKDRLKKELLRLKDKLTDY